MMCALQNNQKWKFKDESNKTTVELVKNKKIRKSIMRDTQPNCENSNKHNVYVAMVR